jgi:hypothetical protein
MFGFGNRSSSRSGYGRGGAFSPRALRRAAIAGLGMLAFRWWRNRRPGNPPATTSWPASGSGPATGSGQGTGSGQVW